MHSMKNRRKSVQHPGNQGIIHRTNKCSFKDRRDVNVECEKEAFYALIRQRKIFSKVVHISTLHSSTTKELGMNSLTKINNKSP